MNKDAPGLCLHKSVLFHSLSREMRRGFLQLFLPSLPRAANANQMLKPPEVSRMRSLFAVIRHPHTECSKAGCVSCLLRSSPHVSAEGNIPSGSHFHAEHMQEHGGWWGRAGLCRKNLQWWCWTGCFPGYCTRVKKPWKPLPLGCWSSAPEHQPLFSMAEQGADSGTVNE